MMAVTEMLQVEKMIRTILLGFILLALYPVGHAIENTNPAFVGVIPQRLERIDTAINAAIAAGEIPGAVALIIHRSCHRSEVVGWTNDRKPETLHEGNYRKTAAGWH